MRVEHNDVRDHCQLDSPATRYTLVAVAPSVADLVDMAGGLLCDRAMCGWTVTAVVHDCVDATPLAILGVGIDCTPADLRPAVEKIAPKILVVSTGSLNGVRCGHADLLTPYDFGETEVLLYGEGYGNQRSDYDLVEYRLSSASRAFKIHAQAAAGHPVPRAEDIETFVRSPTVPQFGSGLRSTDVDSG